MGNIMCTLEEQHIGRDFKCDAIIYFEHRRSM